MGISFQPAGERRFDFLHHQANAFFTVTSFQFCNQALCHGVATRTGLDRIEPFVRILRRATALQRAIGETGGKHDVTRRVGTAASVGVAVA
ncbi:hypothetical protein D3C87_1781430 [compost metagenome]